MKKKGLLIATIVMVLVLAVSLTTATYAWFTAATETTIEEITFSVGTGSDVSIGLKADNVYEAGATSGAFRYGTTPINENYLTEEKPTFINFSAGIEYWTGNEGLGNSIDMQLNLDNMKKAVGTGVLGESATTLDLTKLRTTSVATDGETPGTAGMVMASGTSASVVTGTTVEAAYAQRDYLDVVIGVQAAAADLNTIVCNVTINPTAGVDLGMNAAIHIAWEINGDITDNSDGTPDGNIDVYSTATHKLTTVQTNDYHYGTTVNSLLKTLVDNNNDTTEYGGSNSQTLNNGAINIPIKVADAGQTDGEYNNLDRSTIYQIHLVIWIDGADSDCINQALGVGSEIYINFSATSPNRVPEP